MRPTGRSFLCAVGLMSAVAVRGAATKNLITVACESTNATLKVNEMYSSYQCSNDANWISQPIIGGDVVIKVAADILKLELQSSSASTLNFVATSRATTLTSAFTNLLNFESFYNLKSLTFQGVMFKPSSVELVLPNTVTDIHFIGSVLSDLSLPKYPDDLISIEFNNSSISHFPKFLYERRLNPNMNIVVNLSTVDTSSTLNATESSNLNANAKTLSTQDWAMKLNSSCPTQSLYSAIQGARESDGMVFLCTFENLAAIYDDFSERNDASPAGRNDSGSLSTGVDDTSGGISTGALVAIIVAVTAIAVTLISFILCKYVKCNSEDATAHSIEATATLMSKGDAASEKGSFVLSDEILRSFWLPQSDVELVKSWGTGRLYVGEYNCNKVMVKRIESEVTDSHVTKALMAQARKFAMIAHPNITTLVGVTWLAGTDFAVVTEYMDKGTLKSVLSNANVNLGIAAKIDMCFDIAMALAYLHGSDQNLCVKQLSSRKILVNKALQCKLNLYECVHISAKVGGPSVAAMYSYGMGEIVWLSPEFITRSSPIDARKNNIYAFGVLVCEIFTRVTPYQSLIEKMGNTMSDVELVHRIRRQDMLVPHENRQEYIAVPSNVQQMVEQCLSFAPMSRPTAKDLVDILRNAKTQLAINSN